ncbi:MAG TPA: TadE/TadG family type IV pilus assembly protein [Tepidisphaeraceae bacterium]|nr:TadE/TadG family type IV pilus assembly protein [Tepidisphaeraceae bacterium]
MKSNTNQFGVACNDRLKPRRGRRGTAMMELAIAFPIMLAMAFGLCEFGQYMYIRHCFEGAARDAMREAILSTATQTQVTSTITSTLAQANVTYNSSWCTITDSGPSYTGTVTDVSTVSAGDELTLTLSAKYSTIPCAVRPLYSMTGVGIGPNKMVVGECTMIKE